jgi:hypothetical protein
MGTLPDGFVEGIIGAIGAIVATIISILLTRERKSSRDLQQQLLELNKNLKEKDAESVARLQKESDLERDLKNRQKAKIAYVKFRHLTKRADGNAPAYERHIKRLGRNIEVFDERHLFRLNIFHRNQDDFTCRDSSSGIVDMQIIHPWREELVFSDISAEKAEHDVTQFIAVPSTVYFTKTLYFNGFQMENENIAVKMERDTDEARMIVDFTSVPDFAALIASEPKGLWRRGGEEHPLEVMTAPAGVFTIEKSDLKRDDVLRMDFAIDWESLERRAQA